MVDSVKDFIPENRIFADGHAAGLWDISRPHPQDGGMATTFRLEEKI